MIGTELLKGQGLGNQLFCYVTTRCIAKERDEEFAILGGETLANNIHSFLLTYANSRGKIYIFTCMYYNINCIKNQLVNMANFRDVFCCICTTQIFSPHFALKSSIF